MLKLTNNSHLKLFIGFCLILLHVSNSWCKILSPSVVKIYSNKRYLCAGTLVKANFVVTSATCLACQHDATQLTVAGNVGDVIKINKTAADEPSVIEIFKPRDWNNSTEYMDVAVLKLAESMVGSNIKPAELCNKTSITEGISVTHYMWNVHYERVYSNPVAVLTSEFIAINKKTCAGDNREDVSDTLFYAANVPRIYCIYDKGGPAAIDGQFCGIYNYGPPCVDQYWPGSYTSLANPKVLQFIQESLKN